MRYFIPALPRKDKQPHDGAFSGPSLSAACHTRRSSSSINTRSRDVSGWGALRPATGELTIRSFSTAQLNSLRTILAPGWRQ